MSDEHEQSIKDAVISAFEVCLEAQLRSVRTLKRERISSKPRPRMSKSHPAMSYDILRESGQPLHITDLIERIRRRFDISIDRESFVSSLTKKVLRRDRFTRVAKNTFGLVEWEENV